jgi:hypothetical protein
MIRNNSFLLFLILPIIFLLFLLFFHTYSYFEAPTLSSLFYGVLLPTINYILGITSFKFGLEKRDKIFLVTVFGGLIIRLFLMLLMIILVLEFLFVTLNSFIFTTFIFYFYYLIAEIFYLSQKKTVKSKIN